MRAVGNAARPSPCPLPAYRERVFKLLLLEHSVGDEDGFLALSEDFLEFLLSGLELGAGLVAGFAEGGELGLDVVGGRVLVFEGGAEIGRGLGDRGLGLVVGVAAATTATGAAPATAAESAEGVALDVHDLFDLGRKDLPLVVGGGELFL